MKVADLMDDLDECVGSTEIEKRSNEHLKKPEQTPQGFAEEMLRAMEAITGVGQAVGGGLAAGAALGQNSWANHAAHLQAHQNALNQLANQQMQNVQFANMGGIQQRKGLSGLLGGL